MSSVTQAIFKAQKGDPQSEPQGQQQPPAFIPAPVQSPQQQPQPTMFDVQQNPNGDIGASPQDMANQVLQNMNDAQMRRMQHMQQGQQQQVPQGQQGQLMPQGDVPAQQPLQINPTHQQNPQMQQQWNQQQGMQPQQPAQQGNGFSIDVNAILSGANAPVASELFTPEANATIASNVFQPTENNTNAAMQSIADYTGATLNSTQASVATAFGWGELSPEELQANMATLNSLLVSASVAGAQEAIKATRHSLATDLPKALEGQQATTYNDQVSLELSAIPQLNNGSLNAVNKAIVEAAVRTGVEARLPPSHIREQVMRVITTMQPPTQAQLAPQQPTNFWQKGN